MGVRSIFLTWKTTLTPLFFLQWIRRYVQINGRRHLYELGGEKPSNS